MESKSRPDHSELRYYAALISDAAAMIAPDDDRSQKLSGQSAADRLASLDYHGITLLALENRSLDAEVMELLDRRKPMMIANEALKRAALIDLFEALQSAGLTRYVMFKGTALAYSIYPHPWLRPRSDNDILIDFNELDHFQAVFDTLGYQKLFAIQGRQVSYQSTFSKALAGQSVINIDVHWRINNRQILANAFSLDELHSQGIALAELNDSVTIPNAIDSILIASLHRLGHHHQEERLTWLNDIHYLAGSLAMADWPLLVDKAITKKISAITLDALTLCAELFPLCIPTETISALQAAALQKEPSQVFLNRELPEWKYFWHELQALPSFFDRCGLIIENVFPDPAYVRRQMQTSTAAMGYLKRFWRGLRRVARAGH